jgi:ribosomal protein S18 acetylase RimI-like enzyme
MIRLSPMTSDEYRAFVETLIPDYAEGHVRAGRWKAADAVEKSRAEVEQLLPHRAETPDQYLRIVRDAASGERVGEVWYALQRQEGWPQLFVYWIGIDPAARRKGYATAVFAELEAEARRLGASRTALHVFGDNRGAIALYERLGFQTTNLLMAKSVSA